MAVAFALGGAGRVKDYLNTSKKKTGFKYYDFAKISVSETNEDPKDLMSLVPSFGLNISEPSTYIVHAENNGSPHAICVFVSSSKWVDFYEWDRKGRATVSEVYGWFVDAVDRSTIVTYRVDKVPIVPTENILSELLLLKSRWPEHEAER